MSGVGHTYIGKCHKCGQLEGYGRCWHEDAGCVVIKLSPAETWRCEAARLC